MLLFRRIVHLILYIILPILIIGSCKNSRINKLNDREGRFVVEIEVSAGDDINRLSGDTLNFLTYPFNIGTFEGAKQQVKEVIVIGKRLRDGQKIGVKPIAKLTYVEKSGKRVEMVLARPTDKKLVTAKIDNYFDLLSTHYGVQKMIETWILYSKGYGESKDIKWENEDAAFNFFIS